MPEHKPDPITISEIPLSLPPRDTPMPAGHQTLLSLIDSQRPRDSKGNPILPRRRNAASPLPSLPGGAGPGEAEEEEEEEGEEEEEDLVGPLATAVFWTVPLTFLLFAFDVVVHQQYSQEIEYARVFVRCAKAFPSTSSPPPLPFPSLCVFCICMKILILELVLLTILRLIHPHHSHPLSQLLFFLGSITAGCWLVHAANRHAYYNVMKRAPPVGVLWIWAAAEMQLAWLVGSCLVVGGWVWWGGYEIV